MGISWEEKVAKGTRKKTSAEVTKELADRVSGDLAAEMTPEDEFNTAPAAAPEPSVRGWNKVTENLRGGGLDYTFAGCEHVFSLTSAEVHAYVKGESDLNVPALCPTCSTLGAENRLGE